NIVLKYSASSWTKLRRKLGAWNQSRAAYTNSDIAPAESTASTSVARLIGSGRLPRGWSQLMMNVSRESASGMTHKNGRAVTSWVTKFVVANSSSEAHAGSAI